MEVKVQCAPPVLPVASVALMRNPDAPIAVPRRVMENMTSEDIKALLLLMKTMLTANGEIRWTDVSQLYFVFAFNSLTITFQISAQYNNNRDEGRKRTDKQLSTKFNSIKNKDEWKSSWAEINSLVAQGIQRR
jgi:hypothetical protein